jgi:plastocyanin
MLQPTVSHSMLHHLRREVTGTVSRFGVSRFGRHGRASQLANPARLTNLQPAGWRRYRVPKRASPLIAASVLIGGLLLSTGSVAVAAPVTPQFSITADRAAAVPAGHLWELNDFFPRTATIATGGSFQFTNEGFHTATLLPANWSVAADNDVNGAIAADIDDTALNPNGTIKTVFNIPAILPVPPQGCGTPDAPCVFDGTSIVSMGAPLAGPPAPFVVTVTAPPGTYIFHCRLHPGMTGTLNVVAAGSPGVTTAASAEAAAATQAADDVAAGMAAEAAASKAGQVKHSNGTTTWTITLGTSDPAGRVGVLEMLPRKITIKKGDSVVWRPLDRKAPHTVTFPTALGPGFVPLCEGPGGKDTPAIPTVNPPMSPFDFGCNGRPADEFELTGGNGVTAITSPTTVSDSGIVAYRTEAAGFDLPATAFRSSWWVRFTGARAGTYTYVCQIHEGMDGSIVVR